MTLIMSKRFVNEVSPDGSRYEGEMLRGKFHGRGTLSSTVSNLRYEGEFANGVMHGRGLAHYDNGAVYEG